MAVQDLEMKHWVIRAHVADRAGALTSIASAFSNRGISIDTVVGHGRTASQAAGLDGTVVVTFHCSVDDKNTIVRVVDRLTKVVAVDEHAYDSEVLRKSALITVNRRLVPLDVAGRDSFINYELIDGKQGVFSYFLSGSPSELDPLLGRFIDEGILTDIVYSVVGL